MPKITINFVNPLSYMMPKYNERKAARRRMIVVTSLSECRIFLPMLSGFSSLNWFLP